MSSRSRLLPLLAAGASVVLHACSRGPRDRAMHAVARVAPLIRTDRELYRAEVTPAAVKLTVVATFTNRTRDTLFVHPCAQQPPFPPKIHLEKLVDATWRPAWGPPCFHVLILDPPRLAPGQSRTDTVRVWGTRRPSDYPHFAPGPVAGTYRLVYDWVYRTWDPYRRPGLGEPAADSLLVSNDFRVVE